MDPRQAQANQRIFKWPINMRGKKLNLNSNLRNAK